MVTSKERKGGRGLRDISYYVQNKQATRIYCTAQEIKKKAEQNKEKRMKRIEDSLRDLWDNTKCTNIRIIGVPEEEEKKKGTEKIFEEIIVENFPTVLKEIVNQVQEAQRVPYRINPRRNTPRHILIKLSKIKHKEKILKAAREKQQLIYKRIPLRLTADLSTKLCKTEGSGRTYLK